LHSSNPLQPTQEINEEQQQDGTHLTKNAENTSQETLVEEPSIAQGNQQQVSPIAMDQA
jgi:hypothetical protein